MTIQQLADVYVGHPYEIGEGYTITMERDAYKDGALKVLEELEDILSNEGDDYLAVKNSLMKIKELRGL